VHGVICERDAASCGERLAHGDDERVLRIVARSRGARGGVCDGEEVGSGVASLYMYARVLLCSFCRVQFI
jgi:hypothetical protein